MSTVRKSFVTPEEYLAQERLADFKSEYVRGEVFAMAGATWEHTLVKDNLARETGNQLNDGPYHVLTSDMRVRVDATGLYTYPDIAIVCEEPRFEDDVLDTLLNPRARRSPLGFHREIRSRREVRPLPANPLAAGIRARRAGPASP